MPKITRVEPTKQQLPAKKRVAAYTRVSSAKDAMLQSLSAQVSYYSDLIQKHRDWEYKGVYAEKALTGTKGDRPEFQRLIADCRAGLIDLVLTKSISRFARNTVTMLETVRELKNLGVDVYFERENIHSMSGDGELMLSILASFAQEESLSCSENCKWRIRKDFKEGKPTNRQMMGYKLVDGSLVVVPEEAEIIKQIFEDYLGGMGTLAIHKKLKEQGISYGINGVSYALRNTTYIGELLLQKTFSENHITKRKVKNIGQLPMYRVSDNHEAIISREAFDAVQVEIAKRSARYQPKPQSKKTYPYTGLVQCGACGGNYRRKHAAAGSKYEKIVWICGTYNTYGKTECNSQQIPEDILDAKVAEVGGLAVIDNIIIPCKNRLRFILKNGDVKEVTWEHPSRSQSWTDEMKAQAAENARRGKEEK